MPGNRGTNQTYVYLINCSSVHSLLSSLSPTPNQDQKQLCRFIVLLSLFSMTFDNLHLPCSLVKSNRVGLLVTINFINKHLTNRATIISVTQFPALYITVWLMMPPYLSVIFKLQSILCISRFSG